MSTRDNGKSAVNLKWILITTCLFASTVLASPICFHKGQRVKTVRVPYSEVDIAEVGIKYGKPVIRYSDEYYAKNIFFRAHIEAHECAHIQNGDHLTGLGTFGYNDDYARELNADCVANQNLVRKGWGYYEFRQLVLAWHMEGSESRAAMILRCTGIDASK